MKIQVSSSSISICTKFGVGRLLPAEAQDKNFFSFYAPKAVPRLNWNLKIIIMAKNRGSNWFWVSCKES